MYSAKNIISRNFINFSALMESRWLENKLINWEIKKLAKIAIKIPTTSEKIKNDEKYFFLSIMSL
jgi:hypothetical protein